MIRIILFLIVSVGYILADSPPIKTYKTINECQSDIYFGNGILTKKDEAWTALRSTLKPAILHDIYKGDKAKMNKMHHFDVAYNYSFKEKFGDTMPAMLLDLVESYGQLTNTSSAWWIVDKAKGALADLALGPVDAVGKYGAGTGVSLEGQPGYFRIALSPALLTLLSYIIVILAKIIKCDVSGKGSCRHSHSRACVSCMVWKVLGRRKDRKAALSQ